MEEGYVKIVVGEEDIGVEINQLSIKELYMAIEALTSAINDMIAEDMKNLSGNGVN